MKLIDVIKILFALMVNGCLICNVPLMSRLLVEQSWLADGNPDSTMWVITAAMLSWMCTALAGVSLAAYLFGAIPISIMLFVYLYAVAFGRDPGKNQSRED